MPRIALSIKDTNTSVMRPLMFEVIRDILAITHLTPDTSILFPGNTEVAYHPDTTLSAKNEEREKNRFSNQKRVFIEVDEEYTEEGAITTPVMKPENMFIYVDNALGCYLKPVYSSMEANITVRYRAKDRVEALRWRDEVRSKISMGRQDLIHSPTYSYLIPDTAFIILQEIHRLRENVAPYGDTFREYIDSHFTKRKTTVVTQAGTEPREVITETQRRVIGRFDFNTRPEKAERDGNTDAWTISFSYRLYYEKPIKLIMHYPLVIHNQLLSIKFRQEKPTERDEFHETYRTMSTAGFKSFEPGYDLEQLKYSRGVSIPDFDDFIPSQILPESLRLMTGLILIDMEEDTEFLLDFNDLGDWSMEDDILEFLSKEAKYVTKHYHSIFNLSLYRNYDLMDQSLETIRLDPDLRVILQKAVSLRDFHHIRLSLTTDLDSLTRDALDRLRQNSCVFKKISTAIFPWLQIDKYLSRLDTCGPVTREELENILQETTRFSSRADPSNRIGYNTVQGFFIRAKKREVS